MKAKKTKKKSPKARKATTGRTNVLRTQALATTAKPAAIAAGVGRYAKQHGLTSSEATAKLMTIAIGRVAALSRYNDKPVKKAAAKKKASKAPKRAAKTSAKPKARKVKASAKTARKVKVAGARPIAKAKPNSVAQASLN